MDITMVNREVNSRAVNAMAMTAMMLRLRDAHKERRLNFLIHFLFLTFIFIPLTRFGAHTNQYLKGTFKLIPLARFGAHTNQYF